MRTVLLGANGQLGSDLVKVLAAWSLTPVTRGVLDVCDTAALHKFLLDRKPELVINCTAFHHLDTCEDQPAKAFEVNALVPRELAKACSQLDAKFVHLSTDYAFGLDTTRQTPYSEADTPGPVSVYGASKVAGEYLVRSICPKHFVVRTCGLFGVAGASGKGGNFVELMIRLAKEGKPIKVVTDQVLTPSSTADVAAKIKELVQTEAYGLYHVTNESSCPWYEFAKTIFELTGLKPQFGGQTSAESGARTRRPHYSVLAKDGLKKIGLAPMRPWQEALEDYLIAKGHRARN